MTPEKGLRPSGGQQRLREPRTGYISIYNNLVHRGGATGDFIQVIEESCTGCRQCAISCPMVLFKMRGEVAVLVEDYTERCVECGACYQVCGDDAIRFRMPRGGTGIIVRWG